MKIKPLTLLNGVLAICLVSALLYTSGTITGRSEEKQYDPWVDLNDDGVVDIQDLVKIISLYGTHGTAINKTELLLELMSEIDSLNATLMELESTVNYLNTTVININETVAYLNSTQGLGVPDYDSGWRGISAGQAIWLQHDLNTTELLVYFTAEKGGIHQISYGRDRFRHDMQVYQGAFWSGLNGTHIKVKREQYDNDWSNFRLRIWIIQEPPT